MLDDIARAAEEVNPAIWATVTNKIKLQKGYYSFDDRPYLLEPMASTFRRRCYIKSGQGGGTTAELLKSYHGMIFGYLPTGVLYLFPSTHNMQDFSKAIIGPIIKSNPHSIGKYVKNVKGATDAASLKTINGANLFLRGGSLNQLIEGQGESDNLKGISADSVKFDEIELMDKEAIAKALRAVANSTVKEEVYIGNPGIPGRGIDEIFNGSKTFKGSDQRHWHRKCLHCGEWSCAELTFPECVKIRPDGTGYVGCDKCGKEIFVRDGQWVPAYRDKSDYMHGYRWSHLTSPNHDPAEVLDHFINPPFGNLADVYRLELGLAYVSAEDRLVIGQVLSRCGPFIMGNQDPGPCSFGLDVGKIKHLVIGKRIGVNSYEIVKVVRLSSWSDIAQTVMRFNCISGVIDEGPYYDEAVRFQDMIPGIKTYLCHYSDPVVPTRYDDKTRKVTVHRTGIFDATHNLVAEDGRLTLPRQTPEISEFAKQVCDPAKSLEINKRTNEAVYRYYGNEDHYRNTLNYWLLAAKNTPRADSYSLTRQEQNVDNEYARI